MKQLKRDWEKSLQEAIARYSAAIGVDAAAAAEVPLLVQIPPQSEMGDFAVPMFPYAKLFRRSPQQIAADVSRELQLLDHRPEGLAVNDGPYLNIHAELRGEAGRLWSLLADNPEQYGRSDLFKGSRIMIEFSCPNTNKPLHLGHLRNDSIGMSTAALLEANGAEVRRVNLINDRGVHICKSMLAYLMFGEGKTPENTGIKSDHFVGDYYVRYSTWAKEYPEAEKMAQQMLIDWERGEEKTVDLWSRMNRWAVDGIFITYAKTGVSFDETYYESRTYMLGRDLVLDGLARGVFFREEDSSIWIDLSEIGLDRKVLLRSDGTSLYLTQDLGTAAARHSDWPFDRLIYVVGSEQQYHFKVLFYVLSKLGFGWADHLHHLSYGMVNLPEGKMKSREGTVVDADDLIGTLSGLARQEIIDKNRIDAVDDLDATAEAVALGALNYYLLQVNPGKDMVFNPAESISFTGNTGPYLQYMGARISSMLRKYFSRASANDPSLQESGLEDYSFDPMLLILPEEHQLIAQILRFPDVVKEAGEGLNPSVITSYLYDLSRLYSRYYHDVPIMRAESAPLAAARVILSEMVLHVLKNAFRLIGVPYLDRM